jgi:hypothetical protein
MTGKGGKKINIDKQPKITGFAAGSTVEQIAFAGEAMHHPWEAGSSLSGNPGLPTNTLPFWRKV